LKILKPQELHLHPFTMQRQGAYNVLDLVLMVSCQGIESLNMLAIVGKASCRLSTLSILKILYKLDCIRVVAHLEGRSNNHSRSHA
jgi:hypothetical protein